MRWSRWGRSSYEPDEHLAAEAAAVGAHVQALPPQQDAEILSVPSKLRVDAALLDQAPSARLVITTTSGYDHLDLPELARRGVAAARLPLARRDAVVDSALGMLLWGLRRFGAQNAAAAQGRWTRGELPGYHLRALRGLPVGLVGLGVIGAQMARVLQALGAELWGLDPAGLPEGVRPATLDQMLQGCAAISLHCHLTASTRGLLGAHNLPSARGLVLVNTARGKLLDAEAAVAALDAGQLSALAVDVFPEEPWPRLRAVADRPDLLFTPHGAGFHDGLLAALRAELARAIGAYARGEGVPHRLV